MEHLTEKVLSEISGSGTTETAVGAAGTYIGGIIGAEFGNAALGGAIGSVAATMLYNNINAGYTIYPVTSQGIGSWNASFNPRLIPAYSSAFSTLDSFLKHSRERGGGPL